MIVRRGLLRILWREALPATLVGGIGLSAYTLLWPDVMTAADPWPGRLIFVQCLLLAALLGRFRSPAFAFVYSRGYTRDALWCHMMLASALSVLASWLPGVLIVWTGLRSVVHDHLFQSPYFPVMAPCETWVPLVWLGPYLLFTPAFHYVWIRLAHPSKGGHGGFYASLMLVLALVMAPNMSSLLPGYVAWLAGVSYMVALVAVVLGGRALHRSLEVRT
jgi:hypothetical protein